MLLISRLFVHFGYQKHCSRFLPFNSMYPSLNRCLCLFKSYKSPNARELDLAAQYLNKITRSIVQIGNDECIAVETKMTTVSLWADCVLIVKKIGMGGEWL